MNIEKTLKTEGFGDRFKIVRNLLNESRIVGEKEYTVEYMCYVSGIQDVNAVKRNIADNTEPDYLVKEKLALSFGINKEWLMFGQGEAPFKSNMPSNLFSHDAMSILRNEDLSIIRKFLVVIGKKEGLRELGIIRYRDKHDYEVYPFSYIFHSNVGASGQNQLIQLFRFLRYASNYNLLDGEAYYAQGDEFVELLEGYISPAAARKFKMLSFFIDDFIDLSIERIRGYDVFSNNDDLNRVIGYIRKGVKESDRINEEDDLKIIRKNMSGNRANIESLSNTVKSYPADFNKHSNIQTFNVYLQNILESCKNLVEELDSIEIWNMNLQGGDRDAYIEPDSPEWRILSNRIGIFFDNCHDNEVVDRYREDCIKVLNRASVSKIRREDINNLIVLFNTISDQMFGSSEVSGGKNKDTPKSRQLLFISHSSKDAEYVREFVNLLCRMGMNEDDIICTSVKGLGVPLGGKIYKWLVDAFYRYNIHIIYFLSDNYYRSAASLNEMGAAWAMKSEWDAVLLPGFEFSEIRGCIEKDQISIKLDNDEVKFRLGELREKLAGEFGLKDIKAVRWEEYRDDFLNKVHLIHENIIHEQALDSNDHLPVDESDSGKYVQLSHYASVLLAYASKDVNGEIIVMNMLGGVSIGTYKWNFNAVKDPEREANLMDAIDELLMGDLIRMAGKRDRIYRLTGMGHKLGKEKLEELEIDVENKPEVYLS